jgi:lipopolysaccharide export system protein LptA
LELVQSGNFQFREGSREGRSQNARFEDGGSVVTLDGASVVTDPQMRLEAGQIRLNQEDNSFVATRNVKTVSKNTGEPLLVTAARAQGDGNAMLYTGNVQLWRGNAYIKAERLEASSDNRLHAEGKVQSNLEAIHAQSDMLDYNENQRTAHYTGNVRAQKQDMVLQARDMTAKLREKDVQEIIVTDSVVVTQSDRRGIGDKAVYDASAQSVTLTGKNAEVQDKEHGAVHGTRLIMKITGETIVVEGGVGDRSVTKHTVTK